MKIVLLGPPGAGKGTQAKSISSKYSIPHISTGDIFRKNISENTPLGIQAKGYMDKGQLVPDEVTINMVKDRLVQDDCKNGYLLDGFPRTVKQAEAFEAFLKDKNEALDVALLIDVPSEYILDRMTGRRVCESCGASYHVKFNPPATEGKCDLCGSKIVQRKDDTEETVKERLEVYANETQPLIDFYEKLNLLQKVNGAKPINDVFKAICEVLGENK
ncbi:adenylate kinase [Clostridium sp. BJN0001]|uniref:adenylate kinase n=1 Tax=Clostridium sp. BJN0001 TaxID=2930219 RepID=UPI001FD32E23|nr:adenylate kinase [Clostridium sp. BJN0001]